MCVTRATSEYFSGRGYKAYSSSVALAVLGLVLPFSVYAQTNPVQQKYENCINYFTVGETSCRPIASTPVAAAAISPSAPTLLPPPSQEQQAQQENRVDEYLKDYGKPPREFVEFYLNPTKENALKWVATYQQMLQRSKALSQAWEQADEIYKNTPQLDISTSVTGLPPVKALVSPSATSGAPALNVAPQVPVTPSPAGLPNLGAFGQAAVNTGAMEIGEQSEPTDVVYYFSATCPYCARTTPELAEFNKNNPGKLKLTCVDVTPLGATYRPQPSNIEDKLQCQWRLPTPDELATRNVQETPTMYVTRPHAQSVRLSGYVPPSQLSQFLFGRPSL